MGHCFLISIKRTDRWFQALERYTPVGGTVCGSDQVGTKPHGVTRIKATISIADILDDVKKSISTFLRA